MTKAEPTGKCWCGCNAPTKPGRFFLPFHDRKAEAAHDYGPDKSVVAARKRLEGKS